MLYARELIELMQPYPGRRFKMRQLVGYVMRSGRDDPKAKAAARQAVLRALDSLAYTGHVEITGAAARGGGAEYAWHDQSATCAPQKHDSKRDNCARVNTLAMT
ncbi:MAG: hypothetical protein V4505_25670 [Pseudomonadota bacterium]